MPSMMPNCHICGRFCQPADVGALFNFSTLEEPEDLFFCPRCAGSKLSQAMQKPESLVFGCWWHKPYYIRVAKSVLRHRKSRRQ